jgi:hypothetical protein
MPGNESNGSQSAIDDQFMKRLGFTTLEESREIKMVRRQWTVGHSGTDGGDGSGGGCNN